MKRIFFLLFIMNIEGCKGMQVVYPGFDYSLFDDTPLHTLARAVEANDTLKIGSLVNNKKINVNFLDPEFGHSLLALALVNNDTYSVKKLLSLGADPNVRSKNNSSPFLTACEYSHGIHDAPNILLLLVKYGADVNALQIEEVHNGPYSSMVKTKALEYLCHFGTVEDVKVLVNNGAKLDEFPKNGEKSIVCQTAITGYKLDILKYLLIDKKMPIPDYYGIRFKGTAHEKKISLRELILDRKQLKDLRQQQIENELLKFLKDNGK